MSLRPDAEAEAEAAVPQPAVLDGRLRAVLSVGVRASQGRTSTIFTLPEIRDTTLLSSTSFADNFYAISAYCSTHKLACDTTVWKQLIVQHSVPSEYFDPNMYGELNFVIAITETSTQEETAAYLRVIAQTVKTHDNASDFTRRILRSHPGWAATPNELHEAGQQSPHGYMHVLQERSETQDSMYAIQMKALEFVTMEHDNVLSVNYSGDRVLIMNSLEKGVLNFNLAWIKLVWNNFLPPDSFKNEGLGVRLMRALDGQGRLYNMTSWLYKLSSVIAVIQLPNTDLELVHRDSEYLFQCQLRHAETSVWVLEKLLETNVVLLKYMSTARTSLEAARARLAEARALAASS
tara:strand:- start:1507 stop:2553 length:1047 start_codon:yes stop_codon:yes gene_type:complete